MPTQPTDDELELIRQSGVALRVGRLSLSAGTGSYRVKSSMARVARALGIDRHQAHVTLTEITTTSHRGNSFRTEVTEVRSVGINADRLSELEHLAGSLVGRQATVDEVTAELDRIESKPLLYRPVVNALWAAIACAAFAFLNNGGPVEMGAVFIGAWLGQLVRRLLLHRGLNQFGVTMVAAAVACLAYLGVVSLVHELGATEARHAAGYISAVLFLIPGFPLVTGGLDLAKLDFSAGVARLSYALVVLTSAALAVWGVSMVAGLSPEPAVAPTFDPAVMTALRLVASFVGVLGFALMFNSPGRMALAAAVVGMVANTGRLLLVDADVPVQAAAAGAALLVGVLAALIAPRMGVPRITVSVPAVVIMVPGAAAYRAIFFLSNGDTTSALAYGVQAGLVVIALCIGLAVARMVSDREWAFER
ncbi:threonine/serine exporter family protein [Cellulomonas sp. NPDC089187]|uniref:threonine/serine ThrE exporter family protein n=1 Tax=Cellulomonas sp. NPDC089187 TaxID=3154970 RepID=UPI003421CE7C